MTYFVPTTFERAQKLWKEVKDDTAKYEETITEVKRKGQIGKSKQISYWSTLRPNILNKIASEPSLEDLEVFSSNRQKPVAYMQFTNQKSHSP